MVAAEAAKIVTTKIATAKMATAKMAAAILKHGNRRTKYNKKTTYLPAYL